MPQNFMGSGEFYYFMGIIENRIDPLKIGRCQVRAYAWDTASKAMLPTQNLAWSHPILPLNDNSTNSPQEGTMVFGFYMDGAERQMPMIMGQIPGIPDTPSDPSHGFSDPRNTTQLQNSPRPPESVQYLSDGSGTNITESSNANRYPNNLNEPTTSRIARNENIQSTIIQQKINSTITNIPIGTGTNLKNPPTFNEPKTPYAAIYPFNKVIESEGGNVIELDDTPGASRIHIFHRSGSFIEIGPTGQTVEKTAQNRFNIIMGNKYKNTMGDDIETINGSKNILIEGDCNININGNWNIMVGGNITMSYDNMILNGDVFLNGSLTATGDVIGNNISLDNHVHTGVIKGLDISGPPKEGT